MFIADFNLESRIPTISKAGGSDNYHVTVKLAVDGMTGSMAIEG